VADIDFQVRPPVTDESLNALFAVSWPNHTDHSPTHTLGYSLTYVCAYQDGQLVGFVNVAWDGDQHSFLLNPTVRPDLRHQGIGSELVRRATDEARDHGVVWLHVDYEPALEPFYRQCGFRHTEAGLISLQTDDPVPVVGRSGHIPGQSQDDHVHKPARSRTLDCHRCRDKTLHTWRQWRPWYMVLSHRRWLEGWVCERCGAHKYVWRIRRGRRH